MWAEGGRGGEREKMFLSLRCLPFTFRFSLRPFPPETPDTQVLFLFVTLLTFS